MCIFIYWCVDNREAFAKLALQALGVKEGIEQVLRLTCSWK